MFSECPFNSKGNASFYHLAFDYSFVAWDGFCDKEISHGILGYILESQQVRAVKIKEETFK